MKNKIFSVWFREVCSLVFVQSMQALLLTIMLSVVVKLYIGAGDSYAAKQSMGVYAIIILALVPKVELLVKKIFGMGSGVMDDSMMGGKNSLLKTGIALKLGSSVLNNAGKVIGGVGMMGGAALGGIRHSRISKNNSETASLNEKADKKRMQLNNLSNNSRVSGGNMAALATPSGAYSLDDLTTAIKNANAPDLDEVNRKKRHELTQKALQGLKQSASGIAETAGAIGGAAVGGIVGLGTGGDDVISDMLIGAGVGDKVGRAATDVTVGSLVTANELGYQYGVGRREVKKSIEKKNEAQQKYDDLVKQANKINQNKANKSSQLTAEQRKVYEKAKEAKKAGNMDEYHKNMNIVSGMRKQQKITENKVPTSSSTTSSSTRSKKHTNVRNNAYKPTTPTANRNKSDFNNKNNIDNI